MWHFLQGDRAQAAARNVHQARTWRWAVVSMCLAAVSMAGPGIASVAAQAGSPPVADAGSDQTVVVNSLVQLDGSGSSDPDSQPLTYTWSFISRPAGSAATISNPAAVQPTFVADEVGTYIVQLTVNDGGFSDSDTVSIVAEPNSPPVADAGPDQTVVVGSGVQLDGTASSDPDSQPLTYAWSFVSRPAGSTAALSNPSAVQPTFMADELGTYVVQLIVNDGELSDSDTVSIVAEENSPPIADAGPDQTIVIGSTVQLDGSASSDPDSQPLTYAWSFVSRPPGSTATLSNPSAVQPTFVADRAGTYVVALIVNDGFANSEPDTVTLTDAPPVPTLSSTMLMLLALSLIGVTVGWRAGAGRRGNARQA